VRFRDTGVRSHGKVTIAAYVRGCVDVSSAVV
jgi:hypothetical protein